MGTRTWRWLTSPDMDAWKLFDFQRRLYIFPILAGLVNAEGSETQFWRTCQATFETKDLDARSGARNDPSVRDTISWIGAFSGALVTSHVVRDVDQRLDEAIELFLHLRDPKLAIPYIRSISVGACHGALSRAIGRRDYPRTNATSYDMLAEQVSSSSFASNKAFEDLQTGHQQLLVRVRLGHPTQPWADLALRWLRLIEQDSTHPWWTIHKSSAVYSYDSLTVKIVELLRQ